jgi:hypothetical protein
MSDEGKLLKEWFSFEGRCLVCGFKVPFRVGDPFGDHMGKHREEGIIERTRAPASRFYLYRQVKPHPLGFPGPPAANVPQIELEGSQMTGAQVAG